VVEKDVDVENIERTGTYKGLYFILGGTTSPLDKHPEQRIRITELEKRLTNTAERVEELILALSATTEGEDTAAYLLERITPLTQKQSVKLSVLGRGLSTGTELEYVDADTMKSALAGRHAA
jgi:recombination protein RecR